MAAQPVEAVWVWSFGISAQKATYGRFSSADDRSYTKDYLQTSGDCAELVETLLPPPDGSDQTELTYRWPGGEAGGFVKHSNDRYHFSWSTVDGSPAPWRLTPNPTAAGPQTLPGDPSANTLDGANAALEAYRQQGLDAYLLIVKLKDDPGVVHIRTYIREPPAELAFANAAQLPLVVQTLLSRLNGSRACASVQLDTGGSALTPDVADLLGKLGENPNVLLIGPPGTGKTVLLEKLTRYVENPGGAVTFDPDQNHQAWNETEPAPPGKTRTVVLHPSYSYDNLVVGLLPAPDPHGGVRIEVSTGPLVNLAHYASEHGRTALLVLDEFNRGNVTAALGDTLALLDKDKRGRAYVDLPYPQLDIQVPTDFEANGTTLVPSRFTLPHRLWIVAAMNSSDRSVAPLDAALRRRFSIVEMPPDYDALLLHLDADDAVLGNDITEWTPATVAALAVLLLRALNERIEAVLGRDFMLGQSNFWHVGGATTVEAAHSLALAWDRRVAQTLRLQMQDDDDALAAVLRAGSPEQATGNDHQHAAWWKSADPSLSTFARARLQLNPLAVLPTEQQLHELKRLTGR